jgi:hypothetical protein
MISWCRGAGRLSTSSSQVVVVEGLAVVVAVARGVCCRERQRSRQERRTSLLVRVGPAQRQTLRRAEMETFRRLQVSVLLAAVAVRRGLQPRPPVTGAREAREVEVADLTQLPGQAGWEPQGRAATVETERQVRRVRLAVEEVALLAPGTMVHPLWAAAMAALECRRLLQEPLLVMQVVVAAA